MRHSPQAGFTLLETLLATAILAAAAVGLFGALAAIGRAGAHAAGPRRQAATNFAEQTMRTAADAWKYGSAGAAPSGTFATSLPLPLPSSTPTTMPVQVSAVLSSVTATSATIDITVQYTPDPESGDSGSISLESRVLQKAPAPGSLVSGGAVAMPSGAP